jgi:hypothetical protein
MGFKSMPRDGKQKAGLASGTCHKESAKASDAELGMHSVGKNEKPGANPSVKVSRGHTIK